MKKPNSIETLEYLSNYLQWLEDGHSTSNIQNCLMINFGLKNNIPLNQMSFTTKNLSFLTTTLKDFFNNSSIECMLVFVDGKHIQSLDIILENFSILSNLTGVEPKAVFVTSESGIKLKESSPFNIVS